MGASFLFGGFRRTLPNDFLRPVNEPRTAQVAAGMAARRVMVIEALAGASPEDQVTLLMDALGQIHDPAARIAVLRAVGDATWNDVKEI